MITFYGYINSPRDAMLVFEACRVGMLKRVSRRLSESERSTFVRSGSIFVWDEEESGIKRWTDGVHWSPSRINGSFLAYREVQVCRRVTSDGQFFTENITKENGLVKRAISIVFPGQRKHHLVSYYTMQDLKSGKLPEPSQLPEFASLHLSSELYPDFTGIQETGFMDTGSEDGKGVASPPRAPAYTFNGILPRHRKTSPASSSCSKSDKAEKYLGQKKDVALKKMKKAHFLSTSPVLESQAVKMAMTMTRQSSNTLLEPASHHKEWSSPQPSPCSSASSLSSSPGTMPTHAIMTPHTPRAAEPATWTRFQTNEKGGVILPSLDNILCRPRPKSPPPQQTLDGHPNQHPEFLAHHQWKPLPNDVKLNVLESFRGLKFTRS